MRTYRPGYIDPKDPNSIRSEFLSIHQAANRAEPYLELQELHAEPRKLFEGLIALADGTNWDPGLGKGVYAYLDGAWGFLGIPDAGFVTQEELNQLSVIANEQLRQLTKIRLLLSNMSGVVIEDGELNVPTYQLRELTKISLILSVMTGTVVTDSELTNF